jgi:hypothetical protein
MSSLEGLGDKNPPCWSLRIVTGWTDAGACYKELLDDNNVLWAKGTHMRAAVMEYSTSQDELVVDKIVTMSKHNSERIFAYLPNLLNLVLQVMTGQHTNDNYYIPCTDVLVAELNMSKDELT